MTTLKKHIPMLTGMNFKKVQGGKLDTLSALIEMKQNPPKL